MCSSAGSLGNFKDVKSVSADSGLQDLVVLIFFFTINLFLLFLP